MNDRRSEEEEEADDVFGGCNVISSDGRIGLNATEGRGFTSNVGRRYTGYSGMERKCSTYGEVGMHAAFEAHAQFALGRGGRESACALTGACALARVGATAGARDGVLSTVGWGERREGREGREGKRVGDGGSRQTRETELAPLGGGKGGGWWVGFGGLWVVGWVERSCFASEKKKNRVFGGGEGRIPAPVGHRAWHLSGLGISFLPLFFISFF